VRARAAGLLGERQRVTDAKTFKAAKKKLGIMSRRDGFGRDGEWSWAFPASFTVDTAETAADITPEMPTSVIYADHSRPCGAATSIRRVHGPAERSSRRSRPHPARMELLLGGLEGLRVGDALPLAEQPRHSGTYKRKDLLIRLDKFCPEWKEDGLSGHSDRLDRMARSTRDLLNILDAVATTGTVSAIGAHGALNTPWTSDRRCRSARVVNGPHR
jgi:hypothetical protein